MLYLFLALLRKSTELMLYLVIWHPFVFFYLLSHLLACLFQWKATSKIKTFYRFNKCKAEKKFLIKLDLKLFSNKDNHFRFNNILKVNSYACNRKGENVWNSNPGPSAHCVDTLPIELLGPLVIYQSNPLHVSNTDY